STSFGRAARAVLRHWRLTGIAILVFVATMLGAWTASCGFAGCPGVAELRNFRASEGGLVLDRNGVEIGQLTSVRRVNVSLERIPKVVQEAFIATEDRRFYRH